MPENQKHPIKLLTEPDRETRAKCWCLLCFPAAQGKSLFSKPLDLHSCFECHLVGAEMMGTCTRGQSVTSVPS